MSDGGWGELADEDHLSGLADSRSSRSLERGLAILACFDAERPVRALADIADELGMTCPVAHIYARALVELGYLAEEADGRYMLTSALGTLSSATAGVELQKLARPHLRRLQQRSGLTTGLSVLDGEDVLYLERYGPYCSTCPVARLPAHRTAAGKVLLAYLSEDERRYLLERLTFSSHRPSALQRRTLLLDELGDIEHDGLAINDEEHAPRVQAIAVPIRDHTGEVQAALSLVGSQSEISIGALLSEYRLLLQSTAARISARLGYLR